MGETPEAEELAEWVSKVTKALTLRDLEDRFEYGRTQWGQFRKGSKVVPGWMVDVLVRELVKNPQNREMQLRLGHRLQKAAEAAAVAREARAGALPAGTEGELGIRLDEARKTTIEAQKTLLGATQIIFMLLQMVTSLRSRCEVLEQEKERAAERDSVVPVVERELLETRQKVDLVKKKLARARRTRQEAEELHVTAEVSAARHELALERMRAVPSADTGSEGPGEDETGPTAQSTVSVVEGLPPLWEYDVALEAADQQIDQREAELDGLRAQMGITAQEDTEQDEREVLAGVVVREPSADNTNAEPGPADDSLAGSSPGPAAEEEGRRGPFVRMRERPAFSSRYDGPRDVSEAAVPADGQICLGPLYVPQILGIQLSFGLLDGKPVGLIGDIGDHRFEIRLLTGSWEEGSWTATCRDKAMRELEEYGAPVDTVHRPLIPGWGPAYATRYGVVSDSPGGAKYQVIVTGCDGPGWVFQLTWYRPPDTGDERFVELLSALLRDTVIDPHGRQEAGTFVLQPPSTPLALPDPETPYPDWWSGLYGNEPITDMPSPPPPPPSLSVLSADSTDNTTTSTDNTPPRKLGPARQTAVPAPAWVTLKDIIVTIALVLWSTSLAAGVTHRRWDGDGAKALTLTCVWALCLFVMFLVLWTLIFLVGNTSSTSAGKSRVVSETSVIAVLLGLVLTVAGVITALINPRVLQHLDTWGQALSNTLLA
ncbi:DUF3710 domain-containing protein [Streptomyces sp. NPDC102282]|uniref:DUF3710 domain-containing protein n=1 Tax=Streptomyces sp. NPDC102282 TaxID=3366154 RepID=UPI0037F5D25F